MTRRRGDRDRDTYNDPRIVESYARHRHLQAPEQTVLDRLAGALPRMDMLDIGVGSGRTAGHFAPRVRRYLGIDCAAAMIERCRRDLPAYDFAEGDACRLDTADSAWDFVLFSYNGIDHLELDDRAQALREMKRVLRPGGTMVFSSHNANFLPRVIDDYRFRLGATPRETARSLKWATIFAWRNPTLRFRLPLDVAMVHDGVHAFRSSGICYIRPDVQVAALRQLGMDDIACAGNDATDYMPGDAPAVAAIGTPWVYYWCRKPGTH